MSELESGLSQNQAAPAVVNENLMTQDKANYLITKAKEAAYEKGMQEALAKMPPPQPGMTAEEVKQVVSQALAEQAETFMAKGTVGKFSEGIKAGRLAYEDFDEVAGVFNLEEAPQMVKLVADLPNKEHIMYELGQNPGKFAELQLLVLTKQEKAAERLLGKLAKSIEENQEAKTKAAAKKEPRPLTQLKASTTASASNSGSPYQMTQSEIKAAINARRRY